MIRFMRLAGMGLVIWGGALLAMAEALSRPDEQSHRKARVINLDEYRQTRGNAA